VSLKIYSWPFYHLLWFSVMTYKLSELNSLVTSVMNRSFRFTDKIVFSEIAKASTNKPTLEFKVNYPKSLNLHD
jgi:hypothetical protein